jgi:hypothetical protein
MKPFEQEGTEKTAAAAREWIEQPRNKVTKSAQLGYLVTLLFKTFWRLRPAGGTRGAARNYFVLSTGEIRRRKLLVHGNVLVRLGEGEF